MTTRASSQEGFTLVVIAALFIAFAVIGAVAVERNTTVQQVTRRDATVDQLNRISTAIIEYSVFNRGTDANLYPCPARYDLLPTDVNFGISVTVAGVPSCYDATTDSSGMTAGGLKVMTTSSDIIRGMVPVQTLSQYGISVNDAFDPWNDRIMYVVNRKYTISSPAPHTDGTTNINNPTVNEITTGQLIAQPDFILISYGRDGVGGWKRSNTALTGPDIACPAASTVLRLEDCDDDTIFSQGPSFTTASATPATYFDDILSYYRQ